MRVLLCGGGTAGHVMPAIAIGEIIEEAFPHSVIAFAGRCDGDENRAYSESGHKLYTLDICGLHRSLSINNIKTVFKVLKSSRMSYDIIKDFKPDLIIGTGGYVCYPLIRQGQRLGIKTILHESNVSPGLVTKLLQKRCDAIMLNLEGTKAHLKKCKNTVVVGNPIRSQFGKITKSAARSRIGIKDGETLILSFGGSLGSDKLNCTVGEMITKYTAGKHRIKHIHASGKSRFENMKLEFPNLFKESSNATIVPYIDDMPTYLTAADIAITRSGAMTVSELCRSLTPAILIPSPNVTGNHQYANAAYLESIGAARLIEEKDVNSERLYQEILSLISSPERVKEMTRKMSLIKTVDTKKAIIQTVNEVMFDK